LSELDNVRAEKLAGDKAAERKFDVEKESGVLLRQRLKQTQSSDDLRRQALQETRPQVELVGSELECVKGELSSALSRSCGRGSDDTERGERCSVE